MWIGIWAPFSPKKQKHQAQAKCFVLLPSSVSAFVKHSISDSSREFIYEYMNIYLRLKWKVLDSGFSSANFENDDFSVETGKQMTSLLEK